LFYAHSNGGAISNSYSTCKVDGATEVGGFAGQNSNSARSDGTVGYSSINSSYSTGNVNGRAQVGGFVGWHTSDGTIGNCYYNKETSEQLSDAGRRDGKGQGAGKTTAEMKKKETFADWDFAKIWDITAAANSGYPYLR